ncbi:MAG: DNA polymerase II large subunit [archaeon]
MKYSEDMKKYFDTIEKDVKSEYDFAMKARKKGYDPEDQVSIKLAKNMVERVEGLISSVIPQIIGSGMIDRIHELEEEYGRLDWRVSLKIAEEVAKEKFCKFDDLKLAIEGGIRVGFAYHTLGIVAAPLEGFVGINIKERRDGGKYLEMNYAGPVRGAGGTAASFSVMLGDYVRKKLDIGAYDPTEKEVNRYVTELFDYNDRVTKLQYTPKREEANFFYSNLPVEISGDFSSLEVSNYKDLDRIEGNGIRGGMCLVYSMLCLKSKKLWRRIDDWGREFDMKNWLFLEDFLKLQKKLHASKSSKKKKTNDSKEDKKTHENKLKNIFEIKNNINNHENSHKKLKFNDEEHEKTFYLGNRPTPDTTFITDLVAGRPIYSHPGRIGGFRLRYGRSRTSGFSAASIHPAYQVLSDDSIAIGTQLKTERPGKAAGITTATTLEPPIVLCKEGDVVQVKTVDQAKKIRHKVKKILFLGDMLLNYGDFYENGQPLVPSGYCEETYAVEIEKKIVNSLKLKEKVKDLKYFEKREIYEKNKSNLSKLIKEKIKDNSKELNQYKEKFKSLSDYIDDLDEKKLSQKIIDFIIKPLKTEISYNESFVLSFLFNMPLFPKYSYYWSSITSEETISLIEFINAKSVFKKELEKLILPYNKDIKKILEKVGIEHKTQFEEKIVFSKDHSKTLFYQIGLYKEKINLNLVKRYTGLGVINLTSLITIRDKSGTFVGARMGRPEKAKMRELKGSPHTLFPVGEEGGRMRSLNATYEEKEAELNMVMYKCDDCDKIVSLRRCPFCDKKTKEMYYCSDCGLIEEECEHEPKRYNKRKIPVKEIMDKLKFRHNTKIPDLVKGVRQTSNKDHIAEHPIKGFLRSSYKLGVNKDGTIRYDMSELPITHFKPKEIGTSVEKLKELGYEKDIMGKKLTDDNQVLELKPQDILIPSLDNSFIKSAKKVFHNIANYLDSLLENLYGMEPYYNFESSEEIVGHYVLALAPHTSAASVARVIGFTETQGFFAHPMMHAGLRRDCDGDEGAILLLMDAFLNFSQQYLPDRRGARTMDAPLVLTSILDPAEVDEMFLNLDVVDRYPFEFYKKAFKGIHSAEVDLIEIMEKRLDTPKQYEGLLYTHDTDDINIGVNVSSYKTLPDMAKKLKMQLGIGIKNMAVDSEDVARLTIEKHFIRDIKGNLRKFSMQTFRCGTCNKKYRRVPLKDNKCNVRGCNGKIIYTISEGSIIKYLDYSLDMVNDYPVSNYLKQTIDILNSRIESIFGKDDEMQSSLSSFSK